MSGGVDSSVAAKLMLDQGYECVGCTMKLYNNPDAGCSSKTCCSIRDVEDARSVAVRLGMPYFVFNYMDRIPSGCHGNLRPFLHPRENTKSLH